MKRSNPCRNIDKQSGGVSLTDTPPLVLFWHAPMCVRPLLVSVGETQKKRTTSIEVVLILFTVLCLELSLSCSRVNSSCSVNRSCSVFSLNCSVSSS